MAARKDKTAALLASTVADVTHDQPRTTLVPGIGSRFLRIFLWVVRDTTASLAGATDISFDVFTGFTVRNPDLSGMTTSGTTYRVIYVNDNSNSHETPGTDAVTLFPTVGSSASASATIDTFGYVTD